MKVPGLIPKGKFTFTIPVILLIAVFFIGYYFYYIPTNKDELHKNGFLILQNIKTSIIDRNNDLQNLYKNIFNESINKKIAIDSVLKKNKVAGKPVFNDYTSLQKNNDSILNSSSYKTHGEYIQTIIGRDSFTYLYKNKNDTSILLTAENVLNPILQSQKTELFESYAL